jgi:hypothetical protein
MVYFFPTRHTRNLTRDALSYMILHAIAHTNSSLSHDEVQARLELLFKLRFDPDEVRQAITELVAARKVFFRPDRRVDIHPKQRIDLRVQVQESENLEHRVIQAWVEETRMAEPAFSKAEYRALETDLREYVCRVYRYHGADCVRVLVGDTRFPQELERSGSQTLGRLPVRSPRLTRLRSRLLPLFFLDVSDPERRIYLLGLLNSSFILTMMSGDSPVTAYWVKSWQGAWFYLDTNFLVWLLDIGGRYEHEVARRVVELAAATQVSLKVTQATLVELRELLGRWGRHLQSTTIQRKIQAGLSYLDTRGSILRAYLEHLDKGGEASHFLNRFDRIEHQLQKYRIDIDLYDYSCLLDDAEGRQCYKQLLVDSKRPPNRARHEQFTAGSCTLSEPRRTPTTHSRRRSGFSRATASWSILSDQCSANTHCPPLCTRPHGYS